MKRPNPPRFKPEVSLVFARRCGRDAQAATLALKRLTIDGMIFTSASPQDTAHREYDKMRAAVLASFPPSWRAAVFCAGPSGDSECNIELKPPISEEAMLAIAAAFERAFPGREVVVNGVPLAEAAGCPGKPWTPHTWPQPCTCCQSLPKR